MHAVNANEQPVRFGRCRWVIRQAWSRPPYLRPPGELAALIIVVSRAGCERSFFVNFCSHGGRFYVDKVTFFGNVWLERFRHMVSACSQECVVRICFAPTHQTLQGIVLAWGRSCKWKRIPLWVDGRKREPMGIPCGGVEPGELFVKKGVGAGSGADQGMQDYILKLSVGDLPLI